ncbi:MAG: acyltransferase [Myxococcota bacterium]
MTRARVPSLATRFVRYLPAPLLASGLVVVMALSTTLFAVLLYPLIAIKVIARHPALMRSMEQLLVVAAKAWIDVNSALLSLTQSTVWVVDGLEKLPGDGRYLVVVNHVTASDILVLQRVLNRRIPFLKFFLKSQLIWVPLLGPLWWALDFPFMKRHSREMLEKHPELRADDLETTRRRCARFRDHAVSILSFAEGTRFTTTKHDQQQSPYTHLLRPKVGGIAFVLDAMHGALDALVDVTLVYADPHPTLWRFLGGKIPKLTVDITVRPIPPTLGGGDYVGDAAYRAALQQWIGELWRNKDERIAAIRAT